MTLPSLKSAANQCSGQRETYHGNGGKFVREFHRCLLTVVAAVSSRKFVNVAGPGRAHSRAQGTGLRRPRGIMLERRPGVCQVLLCRRPIARGRFWSACALCTKWPPAPDGEAIVWRVRTTSIRESFNQ